MLFWNILASYISTVTILLLKDLLWCIYNFTKVLERFVCLFVFSIKHFLRVTLCLVIKSVCVIFFSILNLDFIILDYDFFFFFIWKCGWILLTFSRKTRVYQIFSLLCLPGFISGFYVTAIISSSIVCKIKQEIYHCPLSDKYVKYTFTLWKWNNI